MSDNNQRKSFEAWKMARGWISRSRNNTPATDLSGYQDPYTQGQWEAWQAALASQPKPAHNPMLTPRDWQAQAQLEASELLGTPEGAAKLVEAKRYGLMADALEGQQKPN